MSDRGTDGSSHDAYREAGVDIEAGTRAVELMRQSIRSTFGPEVLIDVGYFGGLYALGRYRSPVLVSSADGVGTKLKIAIALDRHDTIGMDLVNHCANDILTTGALPLFFLDYFATGRLVPEQVASVVQGLAAACREMGCALIGGETAEMPDLYSPGDYDLAGFIVGIAERDKVITGDRITEGDALIGLPSSGLHTNGYSLVRKVFGLSQGTPGEARSKLDRYYPELGRTLGEELLEPHRSYLPQIKSLLGSHRIKGMAHITGGGLVDNVPRVLPDGLGVLVRYGTWQVPPVFELIKRAGNIQLREMVHVFNLGVGMVIVCSPKDASWLASNLDGATTIGEVKRLPEGKKFELT